MHLSLTMSKKARLSAIIYMCVCVVSTEYLYCFELPCVIFGNNNNSNSNHNTQRIHLM